MLSNALPREVKRLAVSISPETSIASLNDFAKLITEVISGSTKFVNGLTTDKPARTVEGVDIDHPFPKNIIWVLW